MYRYVQMLIAYLFMPMPNCVEIEGWQVFFPSRYRNFKFQILNPKFLIAMCAFK